jgi:hypothetical protein
MVDSINSAKKAILLWRNIEITNNNANKIITKDYTCFLKNFIFFSILYKNRNLEKYRNKYVKKTGKPWQNATIQDIYNANLVWDILT